MDGTGSLGARKLQYDCPPTPKPREEGGKPAQILPGSCPNCLEYTVLYASGLWAVLADFQAEGQFRLSGLICVGPAVVL